MILFNVAFAMSSGGGQTGQQPGGGMISGLITLGLIFVVFYLLLIRPQQKQQRKVEEMRKNLQKGDRVITTGGIFGEIESISYESIMLKVADKVKIEISRNAVVGIREDAKKGKNKELTKES